MMTSRRSRWRQATTAAATLALLAVGGCAVSQGVRYGEVTAIPGAYAPLPAPLSLGEIVAELRAGRLQADLVGEIRERGLLAPARGADIDLLLREGAGSELIDAVRDESEEMSKAPALPPEVVAAPPVTVVPGYYYGWYPWVPMTFGLWWFGGYDHYHRPLPPGARPHRPPPPAARPLPSPRAPGPFKPSR